MKQSKLFFWIALVVTLTVFVLLLTGSSLLTMALDSEDTVPLGTFITWAGIIALPQTLYWGLQPMRNPQNKWNKTLASLLKLIILLGILWVPVCYGLAGNISFNFTEKATFQGGAVAMRCFWWYTYAIPVGTLLIWALYGMGRLLKRSSS